MRRSRAAYSDVPDRLVHHLHEGEHLLRLGAITVPRLGEPPDDDPWSSGWAADGETIPLGRTVPEALLLHFGRSPAITPAAEAVR